MDIKQAIKDRHSVRAYTQKNIEKDLVDKLNLFIEDINKESGLNIQLVLNEPKAFDCFLAHYGHFKNVTNYIALIGKNDKELNEKLGYYGEKIVLYAQMLGLNTCWVALTYKKIKGAYTLSKDERLSLVISIGYGENNGKNRKSKTFENVSKTKNPPTWFVNGVESALLAPTAVNRQKFTFELIDGKVKVTSNGYCPKVDLGIIKYHFEIAAGKENFEWYK